MDYQTICDMANNLIACLEMCNSQEFIDYITGTVSDCGYCDLEEYKKRIN